MQVSTVRGRHMVTGKSEFSIRVKREAKSSYIGTKVKYISWTKVSGAILVTFIQRQW